MIDWSRMRRALMRLACFALAAAGFGATASAQAVLPDTRTRVRVFFNEGRDYFIGWVLPSSGDSLFLEGSHGDTLTVARTNISKLQVSSGGSRAGSTLIGMAVGLGASAGLGFAIGKPLFIGGAQLGAIAFGGAGLVIGGIAGYNAGGHWRDVPIAARLSPRGATLSIAF